MSSLIDKKEITNTYEWMHSQHGSLAHDVFSSYKTLLAHPAAVLVMDDLRSLCHAKQTTFDTDPYMSAFKAGQRAVLLHIEAMGRIPAAPQRKEDLND